MENQENIDLEAPKRASKAGKEFLISEIQLNVSDNQDKIKFILSEQVNKVSPIIAAMKIRNINSLNNTVILNVPSIPYDQGIKQIAKNQFIEGFRVKFFVEQQEHSKDYLIALSNISPFMITLKPSNQPPQEIDVLNFTRIVQGKTFKQGGDDLLFVSLTLIHTSKENVMFQFENKREKMCFLYYMQHLLMEKYYVLYQMNPNNQIYYMLKDIIASLPNQSVSTSIKELYNQLSELNIQLSKFYFSQLCQSIGQKIPLEDVPNAIQNLFSRKQIQKTFFQYCDRLKYLDDIDPCLDVEGLKHFFLQEQRQVLEKNEVRQIMSEANFQTTTSEISFMQFTKIIYCKQNSIIDPAKSEIYQNMDQPLTDYFINSGRNIFNANLDFIRYRYDRNNESIHNGTLPLLFAINSGVRCFQFDVWNGDQGEPIVMYGPLLSSQIMMKEVLKFLKRFGFLVNPYPIFLMLKNHCDQTQSFLLEDELQTTFGQYLYRIPEYYTDTKRYPSPNNLKNHVVLVGQISQELIEELTEISYREQNRYDDQSGSPISNQQFKQDDREDEFSLDEIQNTENHQMAKFHQQHQMCQIKLKNYLEKQIVDDDNNVAGKHWSEASEEQLKQGEIPSERQDQLIKRFEMQNFRIFNKCMSIERLFGLHEVRQYHSNHIINPFNDTSKINKDQGFEIKKAQDPPQPSLWEVYELNESEFKKIFHEQTNTTNPDEMSKIIAHQFSSLREFHMVGLGKLTPNGQEIDNINYSALAAFSQGFQFIMNNHHSFDFFNLIYSGMFLQNGGRRSGYVLKPEALRKGYTSGARKEKERKTYTINFICGYFLRAGAMEKVDSALQISIVQPTAIAQDSDNCVHFMSNVVEDNHISPVYNLECQFTCSATASIQESFLVVQCINVQNQSLLGWFCGPIHCLRQGYRVVPLKDDNMMTIKHSYILCYCTISNAQVV